MFANFLYGSTDCYFLSQLNNCGALIQVRRKYLRLCSNRIVVTIRERNTVHLLGKNRLQYSEEAFAMLV